MITSPANRSGNKASRTCSGCRRVNPPRRCKPARVMTTAVSSTALPASSTSSVDGCSASADQRGGSPVAAAASSVSSCRVRTFVSTSVPVVLVRPGDADDDDSVCPSVTDSAGGQRAAEAADGDGAAGDEPELLELTEEDDDELDEADAVHPRLGSSRRLSSSCVESLDPRYICSACGHDTLGWDDFEQHAFTSRHGLTASGCPLCRLPRLRHRRCGRQRVGHRCSVTGAVQQLGGPGAVAASISGSHLTSPRPWGFQCCRCEAAFSADARRLVTHLLQAGHGVQRHCRRCLFPVFQYILNGQPWQLHVCLGSSSWLRRYEQALMPQLDA